MEEGLAVKAVPQVGSAEVEEGRLLSVRLGVKCDGKPGIVFTYEAADPDIGEVLAKGDRRG